MAAGASSRTRDLRDLVGAAPAHARAQLPFGAAAISGAVVHAGFLAFFAWQHVWPMALINVGSVAVFLLALWMARRGAITTGVMVSMLEVILHQFLAVYFCGMAPGFQYFLLATAPLPLVAPGLRGRTAILFSGMPVLLYLLLELFHPASRVPPYTVDVAAAVAPVNLVVSFSVLWVFLVFYRQGAEVAEQMMARNAERTEELLHGILPPTIVARLRAGTGVVADAADGVTVLFTDLVGFTPLAQRKTPEQLVKLLDEIFAAFDDHVARHGLEKIKTIGDAYMVAAGVPEPRADHAVAMARLALDLRDEMARQAERFGEPLAIRIGVHTGRVVAGVIGKSKFAYDLWGDAVNTAARMESHGDAGRIHISDDTARALGDAFVLEPRGEVDVKGKGRMKTHWLVAERRPAG